MTAPNVLWIALALLSLNYVSARTVAHRTDVDEQDSTIVMNRLLLPDDTATLHTGRRVEKRSPEVVHMSTPEGEHVDVNTSQNELLNPVVDFIVRIIRSQIIKQGKRQIKIPDVHKQKYKGIGPLGITTKFDATEGWFRDLSSIRRVGDISVSRSGRQVIMEFGIGMKPMEFGYDKYKLKVGLLSVDGHIAGEVDGSSITVKLAMDTNDQSCSVSLLGTTIDILGELNLKVTGMGALNGLYSSVMTWVANKYRDDALPRAERILHKNIEELFDRLSCEEEDVSVY